MNIDLFNQAVGQSNDSLHLLYEYVAQGDLASTRLRTCLWQFLLKVFQPEDTNEVKICKLVALRNKYNSARERIVRQPTVRLAKGPLGPLTGGTEKVSAQRENEVRIQKDVDRTFQKVLFFLEEGTKDKLRNILTAYCREEGLTYQQGMNEVAGIVLYAHHLDFKKQREYGHTCRLASFIRAPQEAEADCYELTARLLNNLKCFYSGQQKCFDKVVGTVGRRLRQLDFGFYQTLQLRQINIEYVLLRWLRCLFAREFGLEAALSLLDVVLLDNFVSSNSMDLLYAVCACLLVQTKPLLEEEERAQFYLEKLNEVEKYSSLPQAIKRAKMLLEAKSEECPLECRLVRGKQLKAQQEDEDDRPPFILFSKDYSKSSQVIEVRKNQPFTYAVGYTSAINQLDEQKKRKESVESLQTKQSTRKQEGKPIFLSNGFTHSEEKKQQNAAERNQIPAKQGSAESSGPKPAQSSGDDSFLLNLMGEVERAKSQLNLQIMRLKGKVEVAGLKEARDILQGLCDRFERM